MAVMAAQERGQRSGQTVAQHGILDARIVHVVLAGNAGNGQDIPKVLDGRRNGNRDDE